MDIGEVKPQWEARLQDPLSTPSREKRRLLLLSSTITLVIVVLELFPSKIEALGITFEAKNRSEMMALLGAVNIYAFIGFFLYAWSDLHLIYRRYQATTTGFIHGGLLNGRATVVESLNFYARFLFEFILPVVYGGYAINRLYTAFITTTHFH